MSSLKIMDQIKFGNFNEFMENIFCDKKNLLWNIKWSFIVIAVYPKLIEKIILKKGMFFFIISYTFTTVSFVIKHSVFLIKFVLKLYTF